MADYCRENGRRQRPEIEPNDGPNNVRSARVEQVQTNGELLTETTLADEQPTRPGKNPKFERIVRQHPRKKKIQAILQQTRNHRRHGGLTYTYGGPTGLDDDEIGLQKHGMQRNTRNLKNTENRLGIVIISY